MIKYLFNIGLALDQFANTVLLGDPDESLSGRCGRAMMSGRPKFWVPYLASIIDWTVLLFKAEYNHCMNSVEAEETPKEKEIWSWVKAQE